MSFMCVQQQLGGCERVPSQTFIDTDISKLPQNVAFLNENRISSCEDITELKSTLNKLGMNIFNDFGTPKCELSI